MGVATRYHRIIFVCVILSLIVRSQVAATVVDVPQDYATLRMAIDSINPGDTIVLDSGTYSGAGFSDITLHEGYTIKSRYGASETRIVGWGPNCLIVFDTLWASSTLVEGITFTNFDHAIEYGTYSRLNVRRCNFEENNFGIYTMPPLFGYVDVDSCFFTSNYVAVYWFTETYMTVRNNVFHRNVIAIWCQYCFADTFAENILAGNEVALYFESGAPRFIYNNVIWNNFYGVKVEGFSYPWPYFDDEFSNNDVFANTFQYTGTANLTGKFGNFSAIPFFCDTTLNALTVSTASPLLAANNPSHVNIGGHAGIGCYNGDVDVSGGVDIADITSLISYLFLNGPPPTPIDAGEIDCLAPIDIADLTVLIAFLFLSGPPPSCL